MTRLTEEAVFRSKMGSILFKRYRGKGIALMFHEVQRDVDAELRTGCAPEQLERVILAVRRQGRDIVTVDEGLQRLADPGGKPFALLTFDDGYRDNVENALPVLEKYNAPITLFVPDGLLERSAYAWWLGLRELLKQRSTLHVAPMQAEFGLYDLPSKTSALRQITSWIGTSQVRAEALGSLFANNEIDLPELIERYVMSPKDLKAVARHSLVTIGAHTSSHRFLSNLKEEECEADIRKNKQYLEALLGQDINYLAYPYGTETACGQREEDIAARLGFKASFTTRPGQLFHAHLDHLQLLPRIDVGYAPQSASALDARLTGLHRRMQAGASKPVATLS
ncbi:MAG: polysaccharide deacetylase family protein [Rhodobacteraceae bacterium]|nr:polysaccharide deacetylase family protein [Paracoccaceae bacterium]